MVERSRTLLLALFALVIVAIGGGAVSALPAADSPGESVADATLDERELTYLSPPTQDVGQQGYEQTGLDVSSAVANDVQRLHGNFSKLAFEERQATFDDPDEYDAFISETTDNLTERILALDTRSETLIQEYNDGHLSTGMLLREFLRLDAAATQQRAFAEHVNQFTAEDTIPNAVEEELVMVSNPVADKLEAGTRETEPRRTVYVQSSDDALVLALSGPEHLRQATLRGARDKDAPDQFTQESETEITLALERANELYPWASISSIGTVFRAAGIYQVDMVHEYTTLTVYLDGGTTDVFHEVQSVQASSVPVSSTATNSTAQLELTVESTDPTGPMRVSVDDAVTANPVEASVAVDGQHVGSTGETGELWVTQPLGTFEVTVTTPGGETATVSGP